MVTSFGLPVFMPEDRPVPGTKFTRVYRSQQPPQRGDSLPLDYTHTIQGMSDRFFDRAYMPYPIGTWANKQATGPVCVFSTLRDAPLGPLRCMIWVCSVEPVMCSDWLHQVGVTLF